MSQIVLREITKCTEEQKKAVREVRNQKSVRKSMYTEHEIPLNEHLAWVERLKNDKRQIVFVVLVNDLVSGVVSVNAIDTLHLKSDWAFYLDASARGGLGAALEFKSEVKVGLDLFENSQLSYSYSHISNNDWGDTNPGTDNQQITFSKNF